MSAIERAARSLDMMGEGARVFWECLNEKEGRQSRRPLLSQQCGRLEL
jgi:hypothetical protein